MRSLGACLFKGCGKPSVVKYEQRLCRDHAHHLELLTGRHKGMAAVLRICVAVHRRMPERDRVALGVAIEKIREKMRATKPKRRAR